ncbi:uncharacterized protein [Palaemon carinicauda]|uniref:uncharacterized protein n=1 Tax=Palaemon carinicauda TaxID=392227 RepID=UPI0035B5AEC7
MLKGSLKKTAEITQVGDILSAPPQVKQGSGRNYRGCLRSHGGGKILLLMEHQLIPKRGQLPYVQDEILRLGLNCHSILHPKPTDKRLEVELLIESICSHQEKGDLKTTDDLQPLLLAESLMDRGRYNSGIVSSGMREAARELRKEAHVTLRRADKTAVFVLIDTEEYHNKLDLILGDSSKFEKLSYNPIEEIKREASKTIEKFNAATNAVHFQTITGDFSPGYLYGNTYYQPVPDANLPPGKRLNSLLTPYVPNVYSVASSIEFLGKLKGSPSSGTIASLHVESLFTNVTVGETIDLILERVYRDPSTPTLNIPEEALRTLLEICTKKAPFTTHRGHTYIQKDGVGMGSPLGVLFANFYMGVVEERVFSQIRLQDVYVRYIDDTFIMAPSTQDIKTLRRTFKECSCLRFTVEHSKDGRLPFLDVLISPNTTGFNTSVYIKPTNLGLCLNGDIECSTIKAYVRRALSHCFS